MLLLSPRHRQHLRRQGGDRNITWIAPKTNDTLLAGQDYVAKWSAPAAPTSSSFQLCLDTPEATSANSTGAANCGSSVSVPLQQAQGMFFVSLSVSSCLNLDPCSLFRTLERSPISRRQTLSFCECTMRRDPILIRLPSLSCFHSKAFTLLIVIIAKSPLQIGLTELPNQRMVPLATPQTRRATPPFQASSSNCTMQLRGKVSPI